MSVSKTFRQKYPDREIVICGDDDVHLQENIGRNKATEAARSISAKVAFPKFKTGQGTDFNDLHVTEGPEAVKECLEGASTVAKVAPVMGGLLENETFEWLEPLPIVDSTSKSLPYPIQELPLTIRDAISEVQGFTQAPVSLVAASALGAVSTVVSGLVDVERSEGLTGPSSVALLLAADSGERKSTVDKFFTEPIRKFEADQYEEMKPIIAEYKASYSSWEARRNGLLSALKDAEKKGKPIKDLEERLKNLERSMPVKPRVPQFLTSDATTEALLFKLAHGWPVSSIISSEGGIVFGSYSMGQDQVMKNLSTLNSLWGGEPLQVDRRTTNSYRVNGARLTICVSVQPEPLKRFIENTNGLFRGSGFFARFLVSQPESTQGYRPFKEAPKDWPSLTVFQNRMLDLLNEPLNLDQAGNLEPLTLKFSPEAEKIWINFYNDIERELLPEGEFASNKDTASKAADNAARLSALFHVFEKGLHGQIQPEHVISAARLVSWYLLEAKKFTNELALPKELANAVKLDTWLIEYCLKNNTSELSTRDVLRNGPPCVRRKIDLDTALSELQELNRIHRFKIDKKLLIKVNPQLLEA